MPSESEVKVNSLILTIESCRFHPKMSIIFHVSIFLRFRDINVCKCKSYIMAINAVNPDRCRENVPVKSKHFFKNKKEEMRK